VGESLDPEVVCLFLYVFIIFVVARNCHFLYNYFIIKCESCSVILIRVSELTKHHPLYFMN
jgi:hypothetical protein